ncbi:hypothetical protein K437DRAFT_294415 [Tilletiaria anomala UBC 951]|uniref:Elongation factor 3 n=1 Tax=Tilletiaria anomala (strain ATCC 24038 / CBS 436.72 / UBC 951) TaxID=1037660 RepID=A0A066W4F1_TILAU|nr:uncharacterized protein K437DRAFT_294415 [Tilletiaria anomala UBC 951]KDN45944.1 hypothetical protein K437DRAFT_294415 [Tilletiaria anomala UBC 951]
MPSALKITGSKSASAAAAAPNGLPGKPQPAGAAAADPRAGAAAAGDASSAALQLAAPDVQPLLHTLYTAPSREECTDAAAALAAHVATHPGGMRLLATHGILASLLSAAANKKNVYEREAAALAIEALAQQQLKQGGADPWLLPQQLPAMLDLHADKADAVVRPAAEQAAAALLALAPPEAALDVLELLCATLRDGAAKWQAKVGALKLIARLSAARAEQVGDALEDLIPVLTNAMHETKAEISKQAVKAANKVCSNTLENADLRPFIPDLVGCMARPDTVPECIKKLSSCTFVAEVTGPALAVMVPLLSRALNERNQSVQRSTVIVVENLCKLVRDPSEASKFLPALTPGVQRIEEGASFPEVREHARSALNTLNAATKDLAARPAAARDATSTMDQMSEEHARTAALDSLCKHIQAQLASSTDADAGADIRKDEWAMTGLRYVSRIIPRLAEKRIVHASAWNESYVLPYLRRVLPSAQAAQAATDALRREYVERDTARFGSAQADDEEEEIVGECLCDIQFSLAYGGLLLLNHTRLRLHRGHRYGILGQNGSGKSTLLKAMRDGKVEGYPSQDVVRTVMVEHSLQGEDGSQAILDFVARGKGMESKQREQIAAALREVGFDDERQTDPVGSLSGGWKMKLELARAMLIGADILLLDEPTNHLDVQSVAWLQQYLVSHNDITVLTVSHDPGFLDAVCTDMMHYNKKKINYYKGNLSAFVAKNPDAETMYSLEAKGEVSFKFPEPGHLMGVRSNTRTILKMSNVTFTYPGMKKPSLMDASMGVTLSSRIGVKGRNGQGKTTMIKCLTGETIPQEGKVEKHPALRIAMMAQHAFHHLEQHLEKTPVQYIAWRYATGHDREIDEKATRKLTDAEEQQMQVPITSTTGEKRRIEYIVGRSKLKKSFQYEIKWLGLQHKHNTWIARERLLELGFSKMLQAFDDFESSREGAGSKELSHKDIRKALENVGLNGEIAEHHEMGGLSGGQKVKVVLAAALWNISQVLILDEPSNFLDRDTLAGLATAIREWGGAIVMISHNEELMENVCNEFIEVEAGRIISKTKKGVALEQGDDGASTPGVGTPLPGSTATSRLNSKAGTPISSAAATPVGSDAEKDDDMSKLKGAPKKKKKMTRNEKKAQEERRRLRLSKWLTYGGEREPDTDDD